MNPGNAWRRPGAEAGGADRVACRTFLELHSAYLDGELGADDRAAHEAHERACPGCARYASVLRRGTALLLGQPELAPSADFHARLQHRLFHLQDETALAAGRSFRSGWLAAAAALVVLAGAGSLVTLRPDASTDAPSTAAAGVAPEPFTDAGAGVWEAPAVRLVAQESALLPSLVGYSPVVVKPPLYQPVSYELLAGE